LAATGRDDEISGEVSDRLDDLFGDDDEAASTESVEETPGEKEEVDPIQDLKSIILSIDWEITDEAMANLVKEITRLKTEFEGNKILLLFLQLLGSLGEYIRSNKAGAHPESFKLLSSVYQNFEQIVHAGDKFSAKQKKKILSTELNKFKELKELIAAKKAAALRAAEEPKPEKVPTPKEDFPIPASDIEVKEPEVPATPTTEEPINVTAAELQQVLDEIRKMIQSEFETLRKEIARMISGS
jgi:hypothetical protein